MTYIPIRVKKKKEKKEGRSLYPSHHRRSTAPLPLLGGLAQALVLARDRGRRVRLPGRRGSGKLLLRRRQRSRVPDGDVVRVLEVDSQSSVFAILAVREAIRGLHAVAVRELGVARCPVKGSLPVRAIVGLVLASTDLEVFLPLIDLGDFCWVDNEGNV